MSVIEPRRAATPQCRPNPPRLRITRCNSSSNNSTSALLPAVVQLPQPTHNPPSPPSKAEWYLDLLDKVSAHAAETQASANGSASNDDAVLQLLDQAYEDLEETFYSRRGYIIPKSERALVDATGGSATYGELMPEGVKAMLHKLDMDSTSVFVDLGSGLGRAVAQVALTSPVKKAIGIELSTSRHEQAQWAISRLQHSHSCRLDHVELRVDDVTIGSAYQDGTHFLLCSTAFSASACRMIAGHLASLPSFQVLVTSRQLPPIPSMRKVGEFACPYSWNLGGTAHVYTRNNLLEAPVTCLSEFLSDRKVAWLPHIHAWHIPITAEETLADL